MQIINNRSKNKLMKSKFKPNTEVVDNNPSQLQSISCQMEIQNHTQTMPQVQLDQSDDQQEECQELSKCQIQDNKHTSSQIGINSKDKIGKQKIKLSKIFCVGIGLFICILLVFILIYSYEKNKNNVKQPVLNSKSLFQTKSEDSNTLNKNKKILEFEQKKQSQNQFQKTKKFSILAQNNQTSNFLSQQEESKKNKAKRQNSETKQVLNELQQLKTFLAIDEKFKVSAQQKLIYQNGTQEAVVMLVQKNKENNQSQLDQNQQQLIPMYMWLGTKPIPQKYKTHLNSLNFYKFIRDCDGLIQMMQKKFMKKFQTIQKVNIRSDLCKIIYLYEYGGFYADLDTVIDLKCLNQYLKGKQNHFQEWNLYSIYFRHAKNVYLLNAIQKFDWYHTTPRYKYFATAFIQQVKNRQYNKTNCIQHFKDNTYLDKTK